MDMNGQRVDRVLAVCLSEYSRSRIQQWIEAGQVTLDGRRVKASERVAAGNRIAVTVCPEPPLTLDAEAIPLSIVYSDEHFLVVDKPAGMVVHPGAGVHQGTLANALIHHFQSLPGDDPLRPGIVHRLDKDTSGLMIVTRTEQCRNAMTAMFAARTIHKEYIALVHGRMPTLYGIIDTPIGRHPTHRLKFCTHALRSRPSRTEWSVERMWNKLTLLKVILHTGRTHQIRVHLSSIQHPIVGDTLYGNPQLARQMTPIDVRQAVETMHRFFLHARRLRFQHPITHDTIDLTTPLPPELQSILSLLSE